MANKTVEEIIAQVIDDYELETKDIGDIYEEASRQLFEATKAIIEAEYQKQPTMGRVGDDGFRKLYIPADFRWDIEKAIRAFYGISEAEGSAE